MTVNMFGLENAILRLKNVKNERDNRNAGLYGRTR
jgi:hypothetical protein